MATSISTRTAILTTHPASNVLPFRSGRPSTIIVSAGRRYAKPRPRSATIADEPRWGWAEAAFLSALSWLRSLVIEGLIHCAFVNHAGDPNTIQQILDERNLTAQTGTRRTAPEVRQ